jgi:hypothetical protein
MSKKKEITYTVGVTLDGPIVVKHDVDVEDIKPQQITPAKPAPHHPQKGKQTTKANVLLKAELPWKKHIVYARNCFSEDLCWAPMNAVAPARRYLSLR